MTNPGGSSDTVWSDPDILWRPPHAYVPGQTPRHPEGMFEDLKTGLCGVPTHRLNETPAWAYGQAFLREGFFWEAHEVLEAVWMACPPNAPERLMVQSVIQQANAKLKAKMGMGRAAQRLEAQSSDLAREAVERAGGRVLGCASEIMQ
ncbi:DUF309 domain-containing protein [Ruegeria halocynthiae]|uniref:DUF309 domain-containing protein n=1 Tax=Ruegeria halocynthiae TaxID=985054 RepID=UPI0009DCA433|nr:DUF309 domain-containing protein [Ruegeria halocynthiae]